MSPPTVQSPSPRRPKARWGAISIAMLPLLIVGALVVLLANQFVGPPHDARERALALMRHEVALLPPYLNSEAAQTIVYDEPFRDPTIEIEYTLPGQCADVHAYYASQTAAVGWSMVGPVHVYRDHANPSNSGHDELDSVFHKNVEGYALELGIGCFRDQSYSAGYTFSMTAH